jgi:ribosomal protein S18 acetylase RimI-like enzyme
MTEEIKYARATLDDLQTIINLRLIFATEFSGQQTAEAIQEFKDYNRDYFQRSIQNNSSVAYLARHDNEIAGVGGIVLLE